MTPEEQREKALRYFMSRFSEEEATQRWEDYCRKSGLLPKKAEPKKRSKEGG